MSPAALATMVAVCGLVWGGFAALLGRALSRERGRRETPAGGRRAR
jgi:hypothetical protein